MASTLFPPNVANERLCNGEVASFADAIELLIAAYEFEKSEGLKDDFVHPVWDTGVEDARAALAIYQQHMAAAVAEMAEWFEDDDPPFAEALESGDYSRLAF
jgi:hypothetical protein